MLQNMLGKDSRFRAISPINLTRTTVWLSNPCVSVAMTYVVLPERQTRTKIRQPNQL